MEALLKITHDRWHNINYIFFIIWHVKKKRTLNVHSGFSVVDNCSLIFLLVSSLFICVIIHFSFLQSGEVVALKKVPLRKIEDGIPNTALRFHSLI